jgi:hypothetical protein
MKPSLYGEANSCSVNQEIPRLLWNLEVYYRVHKSQPPIRIIRRRKNSSLLKLYNRP